MFGCSVRGLIFRITDSSKEQGSNNKKPVNHGGLTGSWFAYAIRGSNC